ncbi:MAG TPA: DNA-protecting protein DprA [Anaerolineae bacterium]|nr:DNA-protecting protein DprA [Anaerolineae bacterium]HIQ06044.1 DNA-protecting protein DprA [Anaerolineae bacterium]
MDDLCYWIGFSMVPGIGPARFRALQGYFGGLEEAWNASAAELREAGLDRRSIRNLMQWRARVDLDAVVQRLRSLGVDVLTWDDEAFPSNLKNIYDPPVVLYVRGELRPEDEWALAVVGTRRATVYGKEVTRRIVTGLAQAGVTIISGLARGIDAQAHRAALEAGGRTIAVLGSGVDIIYPPEHRHLAQEILKAGALVSEYPLGTKPEASNFPPRNRIISGLSRGVIIVEAGLKSGALITADYAAEQGRDVFAVPGSILQRSSAGTNRLIRDGAIPVLDVNDVLEELNLTQIEVQAEIRATVPTDPTEQQLLDLLSANPVHVDEIGRASGLPISVVSSTLALMELKGLVRQVGGMNYVVARESGPVYRVD